MYLNEQLDHWASNTPDSQAIVFEGKAISFAQLAGKVACARGFLSEHCGIRAGDRVAYLGLNHPDMLVILFACESLGAIFNPLNSRLAREEYAFLLANAEPKLCFAEPSFADILHDIGNGDVEILSTGNLYDKPAGRDRSATSVPSSQPLLLVYTSGTTGRPKGVLLSRFAVQVNIENCQDLFQFRQGQRIQMTLPLFHVGGLCILLLPRTDAWFDHPSARQVRPRGYVGRDRSRSNHNFPAGACSNGCNDGTSGMADNRPFKNGICCCRFLADSNPADQKLP